MINAIHGVEGVGRVPVASPFQVAWDGEQRKILEELTRSRTAPLRRMQRARAALAYADGGANAVVARALGVHLDTVRRWRKRFAADGLAALEDRPRPGRLSMRLIRRSAKSRRVAVPKRTIQVPLLGGFPPSAS
ncbi:helix-turn-helix domain-containing protein [Streptomyces sp. NPDC060223]|uniref:helix-turn-helix domain-containing protein n=1 Tax=unclassified Streptomyces TaxID=2593676 RepID=UPI0036336631